MRKRVVTRVTLCICALLGVAAAGFAGLVGLPARRPAADHAPAAAPPLDAAAPPGLRLFDIHCASCHGAEELADGLRAATGVGSAPGEMEAFLAAHEGLEARENREIADYLRELARSPKP